MTGGSVLPLPGPGSVGVPFPDCHPQECVWPLAAIAPGDPVTKGRDCVLFLIGVSLVLGIGDNRKRLVRTQRVQ